MAYVTLACENASHVHTTCVYSYELRSTSSWCSDLSCRWLSSAGGGSWRQQQLMRYSGPCSLPTRPLVCNPLQSPGTGEGPALCSSKRASSTAVASTVLGAGSWDGCPGVPTAMFLRLFCVGPCATAGQIHSPGPWNDSPVNHVRR